MNESLHSLFFAQAIGLYLVIIAIIMLSRAVYYQELLTRLQPGSAAVTVAATLGLIVSIPLVLMHNIWVLEPEVLITIMVWCLLIKSILWLSFPECMVRCTKKLYSGAGYYVVAIIAGIIGTILIAYGFFPFQA